MKKLLIFALTLILLCSCSSSDDTLKQENESLLQRLNELEKSIGSGAEVLENSVESETKATNQPEVVNTNTSTRPNPDELINLIELKPYEWELRSYYYLALEAFNNTDYDITITINVKFYDAEDNLIGVGKKELLAFESNQKMIAFYRTDYKYQKFSYDFEIKYEDYYISLLSKLKTQATIVGDKVIIEVANENEIPADFVEYYILFLKNNTVVDRDSGYITDSDSEIKPNKSELREIKSYEEFDDVLIYLSGRGSK